MMRVVLTVLLCGFLSPAGLAVGPDATSETTLAIRGMTCGGCVAAVKLQLGRAEGVTAYEVSLARSEARVSYDPTTTTPETIFRAQ